MHHVPGHQAAPRRARAPWSGTKAAFGWRSRVTRIASEHSERETRVAISGAEEPNVPSFHPCPPDPGCHHCGSAAASGSDAPDWSFVDAAYCISLRSRPDRAARAAAELHRVGLCRTVVFHRPAKHPTRPKIGIWEAHRAVGLEALARGQRRVLVLEDDVRFAPWVGPRTVRAVGRALAGLPPDWTVFFLGHWPLRAWFVRRNVLRSASGGAHAYVASPRLLEWLRDHPFGTAPFVRLAGTGIDAAYAALPGAYALFPMLATQSGVAGDHLADGARRKLKRPEHLFSRWRHRERLLAGLTRPSELAAVLLSPLSYALDRLGLPLRVRPPKSSNATTAREAEARTRLLPGARRASTGADARPSADGTRRDTRLGPSRCSSGRIAPKARPRR